MAKKKQVAENQLTPVETRFFYITDEKFGLPVNVLYRVQKLQQSNFRSFEYDVMRVKSKSQFRFVPRGELFAVKQAMRDLENGRVDHITVYDTIDDAFKDVKPSEKKKEKAELASGANAVFGASTFDPDTMADDGTPFDETDIPNSGEAKAFGFAPKSAPKIEPLKPSASKKSNRSPQETIARQNAMMTHTEPPKSEKYKTADTRMPHLDLDTTEPKYGLSDKDWKDAVWSAASEKGMTGKALRQALNSYSLAQQFELINEYIRFAILPRTANTKFLPKYEIIEKLVKEFPNTGNYDVERVLYHYAKLFNKNKDENKYKFRIGAKQINLGNLPTKTKVLAIGGVLAYRGVKAVSSGLATAIGSAVSAMRAEAKPMADSKAVEPAKSDKASDTITNTVNNIDNSKTTHEKKESTSSKIYKRAGDIFNNKVLPVAGRFFDKAEDIERKFGIGNHEPKPSTEPVVFRSGRRVPSEQSDEKGAVTVVQKSMSEMSKMFDGFLTKWDKLNKRMNGTKPASDTTVREAQSIEAFDKDTSKDLSAKPESGVAGHIAQADDKVKQEEQKESPGKSFMGRLGDKIMDKGLDRIFRGKTPTNAPTPAGTASKAGSAVANAGKKGFWGKAGQYGLKALKFGRAVPFLGTAIGAGFLAKSMWDGDKAGMALNAAAMVPGLGTAATVADMGYEAYKAGTTNAEPVDGQVKSAAMERQQQQVAELVDQKAKESQDASGQQVVNAVKNITVAGGGGQAPMPIQPRTSDSTFRDYQRSRTSYAGSPRNYA